MDGVIGKQSMAIQISEIEAGLLCKQCAQLKNEVLAKDLDGLRTLQKLIQRISSPQLVRREYMQLPMDDLRALNVAIDFFSAPPATKAQMLEDLQAAGFAVEPASASVMQPE